MKFSENKHEEIFLSDDFLSNSEETPNTLSNQQKTFFTEESESLKGKGKKTRRQAVYKRVKERIIEEAVQLVNDWRDIYNNGYYDNNNKFRRPKNFE